MAVYKLLERPSAGWVAVRVAGAVAGLGVIWAIDSSLPWFYDAMVMLLSTLGGLSLLYASWHSIKLREHLCLMELANDPNDDPELREAIALARDAETRRMLESLGTEWKSNIQGVILLLMAVGAFTLKYA